MSVVLEAEHSYARHWSERYLTNTARCFPQKKIFPDDFDNQDFNKKTTSSRSDDSGNDSEEEVCK